MFAERCTRSTKQSASSCPSSAPNSPRPTPALPSESAPRTRTRLPCTPALAPSNRMSGRARSPRTSPPARAMGRQRARPSHFRSHTSTHPTCVHGGCDALPSVSRLSSPDHQTFAFPPSQKRTWQLYTSLPRRTKRCRAVPARGGCQVIRPLPRPRVPTSRGHPRQRDPSLWRRRRRRRVRVLT